MNTLEQNQTLIRELLQKQSYQFDDLCRVVSVLRGEGGCPWDIEQTHKSIRTGMIEECYEVVEAIDREDTALLREELGDVLLQIVFHADMEKDAGHFNIDDVAHDECVKMITRHPHVFGNVQADTSEQVLRNWEIIKNEEKQRVSLSDKLHAIPPMLPALMRATKVLKKIDYAAQAERDTLIADVEARLADVAAAGKGSERAAIGRLLLEVCALCRSMEIDAEEALGATVNELIEQACEDKSSLSEK